MLRTVLTAVMVIPFVGAVCADAQIICCRIPTPPVRQEPRADSGTLFEAARTGTAAVKELLDAGASPNVKDAYGWTPLMIAIQKGNVEAVKLMLDRGADVNATEKHGMTPAKLALEKKDRRILQLIQKNSSP